MSRRAHRETDRILAGLEDEIALLFAFGLDELNIAALYTEGDYTQRQRLQRVQAHRNYVEGFIIDLIIAGVYSAVAEISGKLNEVYSINYMSIASQEHSAIGGLAVGGLVAGGFAINGARLNHDVTESVGRRLENSIKRGYTPEIMLNELKKELRKWENVAQRMARTQTTRVENEARLEALYYLRSTGQDVKKKWRAVIDSVTRTSHRRANNEVRELEERFSNGLMHPGELGAPHEEIQNCRCWIDVSKELANSENSGIMGADRQGEPLRIPELAASRVSEKINSGEFSTKLSRQQYLKHVAGTVEFNNYSATRKAKGLLPPGTLTISFNEAQRIINEKAGTGIVGVSRKGEMLPHESITADRIIGTTWSGNRLIGTNKARIYYGAKSSHIVPIGGMNYD